MNGGCISGDSSTLNSVRLEGIAQHAQPGNAHLDHISGLERTHARGSSSQNQVAGLKRNGSRDVAQQCGDGKDEVERISVLAQLAVDAGFDGETGLRGSLRR